MEGYIAKWLSVCDFFISVGDFQLSVIFILLNYCLNVKIICLVLFHL